MNASFVEPETENEIQLVLAAQQGSREALGKLFSRYEQMIFAVALRRVGNHAEAQEVCQEAFVRALRKIGQLRQPECFAPWLRQVTVRTALNRVTRRPPDFATESETMNAVCVDPQTPLASALATERQGQVRAGLKRLRRLDRETLVAFYMRGQSLIEMSNRFDSPVGTIKRRLHVARKRLAKELEELQPC